MASSEKPDFIETVKKDAPVELKTGAEPDVQTSSAAEIPASGTGISPVDASSKTATPWCLSRPDHYTDNEGFSLPNEPMRSRKPMKTLPGGSIFLVLLLLVCGFGNQLDEFRNRTLTTLAAGFAIGNAGYVETASDLAQSYRFHYNFRAAKAVLEQAIADLASRNQDKGAQGAFLRLRLANLEIGLKHVAEAKNLARKALEMIGKGGSYVPYDTPFELSALAREFDKYWDYDQALALNLQSEALWPSNRPIGHSKVKADIGFELNRLGQYQMAEDWLKQALSQTLKLGDTGSNAWQLQQLGQAQLGLKKYMEAEVNLKQALEMNEVLQPGSRSIYVVQTLTDLGKVETAKGDLALAQTYLERAAGILKDQRDNGYYYLQNQFGLANLYRETGQFDKARSIYTELIGRLVSGEHGPKLKDVKQDFDIFLAQAGGR